MVRAAQASRRGEMQPHLGLFVEGNLDCADDDPVRFVPEHDERRLLRHPHRLQGEPGKRLAGRQREDGRARDLAEQPALE